MLPAMTVELGQGTGPLRGVKVVEIAGIGPGPHACMILADLGADVIRVERPGGQLLSGGATMLLNRGRPSVALDLKQPEAAATVLELVKDADLLVEGMRPGVTERLGIGPEQCHAVNPRLVYGRMTGWGQDGPLAQAAGHDLNYISVAGALFGMGQTPDRPQFPANLVGDFGGGSTYLVIGLLAALLEARVSGQGQVVDAAIVDGTAHLNAMTSAFLASGGYQERRGANLLDGGVPFYDVYETSDGKHVSVGALEPQFYATLIGMLGLEDTAPGQADLDRYDELRDPAHRHLQAEDAGRVGRAVRGHRRLRRRGDPGQRGARAPAPQGPADLRRARGTDAAAAGAAVLAHRGVAVAAALAGRRHAHPRGAHRVGHRRRRRAHRARRGGPGVKPFLFLGIRAQDAAADDEYAAVLRCAGLDERDVRRVRLERDELEPLDLDDWSGIVIGGGPWNVSDPESSKAPEQRRGEARLRELALQALDADFPFLGACYGIGTLGTLRGGRRRPDSGPSRSARSRSR